MSAMRFVPVGTGDRKQLLTRWATLGIVKILPRDATARSPIRSVWALMLVQTILCVFFGAVLWLAYLIVARWKDPGYWTDTGHGWRHLVYATPAGDGSPTAPPAVEAIGQAVPAIVIAMFVFGVGTAFVVAQVVPPARGARAVQVLQGRRFGATISPALTLLAGSALLLTEPGAPYVHLRSFSITLMVGSVVYVLAATAVLLSIYRDATDPESFRRLLEHRAELALSKGRFLRWRPVQRRRVYDLYELVRTIRGWARVSATTGDSRELNEALTCMTQVTDKYVASEIAQRDRTKGNQPSEYRRARDVEHHRSTRWVTGAGNDSHGDPYDSWVSLALGQANSEVVAGTWFADEVGRALVRSVEYGLQTQSLLDRDLLRLMNTMAICCQKLSALPGPDRDCCTWLFVRCFTEVGCQARNFTEQPEDWFYSPAIHLLHLYDRLDEQDRLRVASEAGLLLVVAAILSRRDAADDKKAAAEGLGKLFRRHRATDAVQWSDTASDRPGTSLALAEDVQALAVTALLWPEGRPLLDLEALDDIHQGLRDGIAS